MANENKTKDHLDERDFSHAANKLVQLTCTYLKSDNNII